MGAKFRKDLGFCIIERNMPIAGIENKVKKAFKVSKSFFGRAPKGVFKIKICDTEKEFKKEAKYYYFPMGKGTVLRDRTFVVKSDSFLKMSSGDYQTILDHEMNHVFWMSFYKSTKPEWIFEGLGSILGYRFKTTKTELLNFINRHNISSDILQYRYIKSKFDTGFEEFIKTYQLWRDFILYITKQKPKLIVMFLDEFNKLNTRANYDRLFKRYFKGTHTSRFRDFKRYLEY